MTEKRDKIEPTLWLVDDYNLAPPEVREAFDIHSKKMAIRRDQQRRMFRKRTKLHKWAWRKDEPYHKLKHTATPCSCDSCRNPRRSMWYKGCERLTVQERKFAESADQQEREYPSRNLDEEGK